mmetsp:Transcript_17621/g.15535  ORF Transcript_17621/g.15535 Transcript_17621/m.15535 type:complete len:106 (+) Transcript_17621:475-792(+)
MANKLMGLLESKMYEKFTQTDESNPISCELSRSFLSSTESDTVDYAKFVEHMARYPSAFKQYYNDLLNNLAFSAINPDIKSINMIIQSSSMILKEKKDESKAIFQ